MGDTLFKGVTTTSRIRELVAGGVITIGVHISRDGIDVWARCVQPHPGLGLSTYTSHTLPAIEELLAKVVVRSGRVSTSTTSSEPERVQKGKGIQYEGPRIEGTDKGFIRSAELSSVGVKSLDEAILHCKQARLGSGYQNGVYNQLPVDSLAPLDFKRNRKDLFARVCSVVDALTTPKLVSRILSQEKLRITGVDDLSDWWRKATAEQKLMLVSRAKAFPKGPLGEGTRVEQKYLARLDTLPHPFRDAEAQVGQSEAEHSAEDFSSDEAQEEGASGVILDW